MGVEPDQTDARRGTVGLLQTTDHAGYGGAVAADDEDRFAGAASRGHGLGNLATDEAQIVGRLFQATLLRKLWLGDRRFTQHVVRTCGGIVVDGIALRLSPFVSLVAHVDNVKTRHRGHAALSLRSDLTIGRGSSATTCRYYRASNSRPPQERRMRSIWR